VRASNIFLHFMPQHYTECGLVNEGFSKCQSSRTIGSARPKCKKLRIAVWDYLQSRSK
jgi:hypothetical protein